MAWPAVVAALGSAAASILGSSGGTSLKKSAMLQEHQEAMQERYLNHYYTNARQSLENAGYNPMLAYMETPTGGATSATAVEDNRGATASNAINQGFQNYLQAYTTDASVNNTNANTTLQETQAITEMYKQLNIDADTKLKQIDTKLRNVDLKYSDREHLIRQQKDINEMKSRWMDALSHRMIAGSSVTNADSNKITSLANDFSARNKGYTTHVSLPFGFGFSHTGAPNAYTELKNYNKQKRYVIQYEKINGKSVPVKVYR